ncbi:hypothetical protein ABTX80_24925 [Streptomyces erythrochromogenes]|uniref:hypothetical protein n=1 Tax=Streptomyces erythrochromogenes TaxID=285574 RepID=UPI00331BC309
MTLPTPAADFEAAATVLRDAAFAPGATTVTLPAPVVNAIANWLDDAGSTAEQLGAPDPIAQIAAVQILHPHLNLSGWCPDTHPAPDA